MEPTSIDLRYPIGKYVAQPYSEQLETQWLNDIKLLPLQLEQAVLNLDAHQLHTAYREGGWTVQQLVHHIADSHMNAYIRFKLGLTESNPIIKTYDEKAWAEMQDVENLPINVSITLLHALHLRWVEALIDLKEDQWNRTLLHPEHNRTLTLWHFLGLYAWHGNHHVAHINSLRRRNNW